MDLGLKGTSVLITGGSKGIGLACARSFAAEGARLHLAARDEDRLDRAKSDLGEQPSFEYVCGAAANAGLANFTRAMGRGSREHGVRVVAVHPPATRTDRIITLMKAQAKARFGDESRHQELMGHVIEPEQVADMVCFLASARASQLSGVVYNLGA